MECQLKNATVHYTVHGTGKPIIILHGNTMDHRLMTGCMEPLFTDESEWQRIYLDLPGMGQTKGEEWMQGTDDMLTVVLEFIDAVIPGQRFLIVGESYGGYLSRGVLAQKHDLIDGMALLCPMIVADRTIRELPPKTVVHRDEQYLASVPAGEERERLEHLTVVHDQYVWDRCRQEAFSGTSVADYDFLTKVSERFGYSFDVDAGMPTFERPVLFLLGKQDAITGYADALKLIGTYPRASFAILDRAGHMLQLEQPELFQALMTEWLKRVTETSAYE